MTLEVLERRPADGPTGKPPLVFVHGYWQAAWCWDEYLMPDMANRGYDCFAVSLTGHGGSDGKIRGRSIVDNVEDVYSLMARFDDPPVVIGHSMGGYTTQHYLARRHPALAAVLVSPVPARGAWKATWKAARAHPGKFIKANLSLDIGAVVENPDHAYEYLFSPDFPRGEADRYVGRWERASYKTYLNLLFSRPKIENIDVPVLIIGGDRDGLFDVAEWEETAKDLGAELRIIEGAGHQLMLEPAWSTLADEIDTFVGGL